MKLRSLLHRRQSDKLPLLPATESEDGHIVRGVFSLREQKSSAQEERLERLLTPKELDLVRENRL
ncbi:hypothetical protein [Nocardia arthritidis]|uniref:Uncharacterized protein n=1 Tax=Nocardia arthritidis TaxID=228602 RepID=A0A6G9YSZ3_9NOCA|nr:hypothetical protein [Nocardia arthritidis]QIS16227.1 hypothetical protein F5544_42090 [Nocardia arthritidis]